MPAVAIYTRISSDPLGQSTSTSRQERHCRAFASLRGWDVVEVYEDIDVSAYKRGVRRPNFDRLQADLPGLDGVLVWRLDRLVRRPADFEKFWGRCEEQDVFLASATEPVDSSSELGVAIVRILVTFAQLESHARSARLRAKAEEVARSGAPPKQAPCYGHSQDWAELVPAEAELIREAAHRYLAGESLSVIAASFNRQGRLTRGQNRWQASTLRTLLSAHRIVGDRSYRGTVVAKGSWPPILDRDTFDAVQASLANHPQRRPMTRGLLTGWLVCGRCGGRLSGKSVNRGLYPGYGCQPDATSDEPVRCGLGISAPPTDAWIAHQIMWRSRLTARWSPKLLRLAPTPLSPETWTLLTRDEQRTHIGKYLDRIVVLRAESRNRWSADRLVPHWKHELPEAPPFAWLRDSFDRRIQQAGDDAINAHEAASILSCSGWDVSKLRKEGSLQAIEQIGRRWIYSRAAVETLRDRRVGTPLFPRSSQA